MRARPRARLPMTRLLATAPPPETGPAWTGWAVLLLVVGAVLIALWAFGRLVEREQDRPD